MPSGGLAPALPDNPAIAVPDGGHGGFGRRIYQPYQKVFSPSPHPPSPMGKGEIFGLFRRGLPPPAPLRLNPGGTGAGAAYHAPTGGLPRRCQITLPSLSPTGGTAVLVAGFTSHITKFYPLSPRPPSPVGKGEFFGLFRRGLPPPAPLRLNPGGAGAGGAILHRVGGLPRRCRITLPSLSPTGGSTAVLVAG